MIAKICLVLIFFGVAIGVGIYCRRSTTSVDGFVLGGRNVGAWMSAFAFGTSYFSAVVFVGYAGQFGWKYGIAAFWAGLANAILGSLMAWWVLGPRTREMTHRIGATTMPEFFGLRYQSKALRIAAAAIIFVFLIPYTASVYNGLSRLFGMAFGLPYEVCVIAMALITCIYVVVGGYMATVVNDFLQGIVMLFGIAAVILAVMSANGGFMEAMTTLSQVPSETGFQGVFTSMFGPDPANLLGVVILTSLGTWGLPQMVQKFYAIKDGPAIKQGAIISTLFAVVVAGGCYFLGGFGRLYADQIAYTDAGTPVFDSIIPTMLSTLPEVLIGLVIVLVLSASMSTLAGLVLNSSSTLTLDFIEGNIVKNMDEKKRIVYMRVFIVVFILLSAAIALVQYHSTITWIAQLMGISWGALSGAFIGPYLWGLYSGKISRAAVWTSFIFAVCLTTGNMLIGLAGLTPALQGAVAGIPIVSWVFANGLNCGAFAMMASIVIVPLVSLFTKAVPFDVNPPEPKSATDREIDQQIGKELGAPAEALIDA
ncbi:MAG: sodium:solute symporter [Coriobacteriia bacterium]|nr:sodium:solute symporter [Coriobacteriia bacterium]